MLELIPHNQEVPNWNKKSGVENLDDDIFKTTVGFIKITKQYRFSYRQREHQEDLQNEEEERKTKKNRHKKESTRKDSKSKFHCFSRCPIDSLVRGVFFNAKEMELYLKTCRDHTHHQTRGKMYVKNWHTMTKLEKKLHDEEQDKVMIRNYIKILCQEILNLFDSGDFVKCGIKMLILHAFLATSGMYNFNKTLA